MKRSKRLVLTSMMAGGSLSLGACGDDTPSAAQWGDPPAATASAEQVDARAFASLEECKAAGDLAPADCDQAYKAALAEHEKSAPRFDSQPSCEEQYGVGQCVPRGSGSGSFFTPLLTGFLVGQALSNIGGGGGFFGRPYYRDSYGYNTLSNGRRLDRGYVSGRYRVGREVYAPPRAQAPTRVQSRSAVVSRGGFGGGGGRSYGG